MKRSEMLKIVEKALKDCWWSKQTLEKDSEYILQKIEEAGMLPPQVIVNTEEEFYVSSKWESEREKPK